MQALRHTYRQPYWWGGALLLLVCIAAFALTGSPLPLALPVGVLFVLLFIQNWKLAFWLMLLTIPPSVDLGYLGLPLSTSVPDEPIMWLFLLTTIILLAARRLRLPLWWLKNPLTLILTLQLLWLIVAVVFSQNHMLSLKFLAAKLWFLNAFLVIPIFIFKEKRDFVVAFRLFGITLTLTAIVILIRHALLGFDFMKIHRAVSYLYYNRVEYSTVLSMFFALLCVGVPLTKGRPWQRAVVVCTIILFLPAIYFTFARAAILAIVFMFGVNLAVRLRLMNWVFPLFFGFIIFLVVYLVQNNKFYDYRPNFHQTYTHTSLESHLVATFRGEDMSSMERLYRWIASVRMTKDHPLVGVGPNNFYEHYKPYAVTTFKTYVSRNPERSTTHNYFLFMLVEQGIPAMILYGVLVFAFFYQAQKVWWRFRYRDRFYRNVTMGIIMMFAAGFINNFFSELLETHKVGALFYLAIALLMVLDHKSKELEKEGLTAVAE